VARVYGCPSSVRKAAERSVQLLPIHDSGNEEYAAAL
jgi:hypothetical protein